jgi:hypothetical protein
MKIERTMNCRSICLVLLLTCCTLAAEPNDDEAAAKALATRIEKLVAQLGADDFAVREAASKELAEIGNPARLALEKAALDPDPETSSRAKVLLDRLPKLTHTIVDALGAPIPLAKLSLQLLKNPGAEVPFNAPEGEPLLSLADAAGRAALPDTSAETSLRRALATIEHPQYGRARCEVFLDRDPKTIQFPLVRRGSEASKRALSGQVVDEAGKPLAGAVVSCDNVRTPGEGLIDGDNPRGEVLADDEGRFAIYPSNSQRDRGRGRERGELIPANSRYALRAAVPGNDSYFPLGGRYPNTKPARLELRHATRRFRFRFESIKGGMIEDAALLRQIHIRSDELKDGEQILIPLDPKAAVDGSKLPTGTYVAEMFTNNGRVTFQPVTVTADSPDELVFRLPEVITYRGRVVQGVTGEPLAGAFLMAWNSTSHNNLALLTADEWKALRELPAEPPTFLPSVYPPGEAKKRLEQMYGVQALVRTDAEGRFEVRRRADQEFYGLLAFDEDYVPYKVTVGQLKANDKHVVETGDYPLYPAAKVLVRPSFVGERLAVSPAWLFEDEDQPEWFKQFRAADQGYQRRFEYVYWLTLNEVQPIFVPAGVRLKLRFDCPYDDKWAPALVKQPLQLKAGTTHEAGDLTFAEGMQCEVRVVDGDGKPVEGMPVRRMYAGTNAWSVAHNTDMEGLAHFYLHPNSRGQFRASDLREAAGKSNLIIEFTVEDKPPAEPPMITVTTEQIQAVRGESVKR